MRGPSLLLLRRLALVLLAAPFFARGDEVDDFLVAQMRWQHIPGLSLAVIKSGTPVKAQGYGWANVETNAPATAESAYKIGSLSKQFLASAILVLAQEGKLALGDPAPKYLPDLPEAWRAITIRHLLSHTAGLARELPGFDPFKRETDAAALKSAYALPLRFPPGEKWEYSNIGYYALAEIIRTVAGKPWSEFIAERIFVPAGMTATRATTPEIVPHRVSGYAGRGRRLVNAPEWLVVRPSGAFLSTVLDLARWDAALSSDTILNADSRAALGTPIALNGGGSHPYGYGWFTDTANGHRRLRHDGGLPGFVADFERFPDDQLTVILLANREGRDLRDLALRIAGFYAPALLPAEEKPIADAEPRVTERVRGIVAAFARGEPEAAPFTPELGRVLVAEMNAGGSEDLRQLGPIQSFHLVERRDEAGERVYRYRLGFRHVPLFVRCAFNAEGQIAKFAIYD